TSWAEMYQVFNMGHRMELYVLESAAASIIDIARPFGIEAAVVGRVEQASGAQVCIEVPYGRFGFNK
ncbi:MAG: phosphoribosylformylglycinamidine cyclo-ligase, partial [Bacteroidales bacterium]|nr:phosphoribosylformylglycinamidine cyclo-ligase [Bacteroidales bacterium]